MVEKYTKKQKTAEQRTGGKFEWWTAGGEYADDTVNLHRRYDEYV